MRCQHDNLASPTTHLSWSRCNFSGLPLRCKICRHSLPRPYSSDAGELDISQQDGREYQTGGNIRARFRRWLVGNQLCVARNAELGIGVASDRLYVAKTPPARYTFVTNRNCSDVVEAAIRPSCSIGRNGLRTDIRRFRLGKIAPKVASRSATRTKGEFAAVVPMAALRFRFAMCICDECSSAHTF